MARRNRVDPWGDLHLVEGAAGFTGNRGCLVDGTGAVVRRSAIRPWITCLLHYKGRRQPLAAPRTWTPLFFLDDAVALAAGHRPCGLCRRADHQAFTAAAGAASAPALDRALAAERGRTRTARAADLPDGTVVVDDCGRALLLRADAVRPFAFEGWGPAEQRPSGAVAVLTPPTSVAALRAGFVPVLND